MTDIFYWRAKIFFWQFLVWTLNIFHLWTCNKISQLWWKSNTKKFCQGNIFCTEREETVFLFSFLSVRVLWAIIFWKITRKKFYTNFNHRYNSRFFCHNDNFLNSTEIFLTKFWNHGNLIFLFFFNGFFMIPTISNFKNPT